MPINTEILLQKIENNIMDYNELYKVLKNEK